jgi:malonyl-CoA O-methyltransferase
MTAPARVAAAFAAAAGSYDDAADIQRVAARHLAARVLALPLPPAPRVLELGCGTGLLTRLLLPALPGSWTVTDLAPAMVARARAALPAGIVDFRVMDATRPDPALGTFDLIVSNMAAQWFPDLAEALALIQRLLNPAGRLLLTTLGAASFAEWRAAHARLGLEPGTPAYPDAATLTRLLPAAAIARVVAEPVPVEYANGRAFATRLKATGATTPVSGHRPLSPGAMRRVLAALGAPCAITYEVLTVDLSGRPA